MNDPGEFRHRVQIIGNVGTTPGLQGPIAVDDVLAEPWAKIEPLRSAEYWRAQTSSHAATHRITLRFRPDFQLTTRHWIKHEGRRFDIDEAIDPLERNEFFVLLVHEHETAA